MKKIDESQIEDFQAIARNLDIRFKIIHNFMQISNKFASSLDVHSIYINS